ncbi:hypothetical protein B0F87_10529 [Methylobacter tundripaludum]|uniref:Glycine zipper family protein n=1 Tax=Methylobacter tundripaludum TaxID=173365 RepID=A0A2S6HDU0_9GAMM|nr:glycine zipper family protein [Methylobacter tundripaludum]PPK75563.1 hypothetical protein B0F87_10529 [Methylobacter tundripaludum]
MLQILTILMSVFLLNACSTMPSGPSVLVLPGIGKNFDQFHNDDLVCRQLSHTQITTSRQQPDSKEDAQQDYDISYIQCMYGKGHRIPVPDELMYNSRLEEWFPPPPDMPAPPQAAGPEPSLNSLPAEAAKAHK